MHTEMSNVVTCLSNGFHRPEYSSGGKSGLRLSCVMRMAFEPSLLPIFKRHIQAIISVQTLFFYNVK